MAKPLATGVFKTRKQLERKVLSLVKKNSYAKVAAECGIGVKTAWKIHKDSLGQQ
jgi:hypothetical protein